jgi:hypothetical protein
MPSHRIALYLVIEDKKVWSDWILIHRWSMNEAQHERNQRSNR